jgi:hypothetical protein
MARLDLVLGTPQQAQSALTEDMFGANYVYDYERIGDLPWARFDELIDQLGSTTLRYPGGNAVETRFNYLDPNSSVDLAGKAVMGMDDFISWAGVNGISPTILLPTKPFLPSQSHALLKWESGSGGWVIDPSAMAAAKALVFNLVETAVEAAHDADTTIAAFELGNEFSGVTFTGADGTIKHMNGAQYGLLADAMAQWVDEALQSFNAGGDPQIVVQVWGDYNRDSINPTQLSNINDNVLAAFSKEGLAAIDATSSHIYFKEGKTTADGQFTHSYAGLDERIAQMAALSDVWSDAAGRTLDLHVTEWNVQKQGIYEPSASYWQSNSSWNVSEDWVETANFGMKQLAPMLEMVSAFNMAGVDAAQVWSVMYNAAALGMQHNGGTLTAAGGMFALMQDILPGTHYLEVAAEQQDADLHVFRGDGQTHVFVSLRSADPHNVTVDLEALSPLLDTVVVTYLRPNEAAADGAFSADGNTYLVGDRSWLEADIGLIREDGPVILTDEGIDLELGPYEVALISFEDTSWNTISGSEATEALSGTDGADQIFGLDGDDYLRGEAGDDWLEGGEGADALYGGTGSDTLEGGKGDDWLQGGSGKYNDYIYGENGDDRAYGGNGTDKIWGGEGSDKIWGDGGDDKLSGQWGSDTLYGGSGNDRVVGGASSDLLHGNSGQDILRGEAGDDQLYGGEDRDYFEFLMAKNSGRDRIMDFEDGLDVFKMRAINDATFEDLIIRERGSDTLVAWEKGSFLVEETEASLIDEDDFLFA